MQRDVSHARGHKRIGEKEKKSKKCTSTQLQFGLSMFFRLSICSIFWSRNPLYGRMQRVTWICKKKHHYASVTLPFLCSCIRRLDLAMMVNDDTAGYVDR